MKIIRVIGSTATANRDSFTNKFAQPIKLDPNSEIALVNCMVPIENLDSILVDETNREFSITVDGLEVPVVDLAPGTYTTDTLLQEISTNLYQYSLSFLRGARTLGLEWNVNVDSTNKLQLSFDKVDDYLVTDAIPHLNRNTDAAQGPLLIYEPNFSSWRRNLAAGGGDTAGWAYSGIPFNKGYAKMAASIGTSRLANNTYTDWYMGLVLGADRPQRATGFAYNVDMQYGVYLLTAAGPDPRVNIRHEGVTHADVPIDTIDGLLPAGAEVVMSTGAIFADFYMVYQFFDMDGVNLCDVNDPSYDDELEGYIYPITQYPSNDTLYPIWGVGADAEAELVNLYYTPSTTAIEETGFVRSQVDVAIDLPTLGVRNLLGIHTGIVRATNTGGPGLFSGTSVLGSNFLLESLAVFLVNQTLDCYDGSSKGGRADAGQRRSIIGVLPGAYKEDYSISYEPCNLLWVPLKNPLKDELHEITWGFAFGNEFKPYLAVNSMLTLAIRPRNEQD